jgi:ubiquitin carboxyl-terminal hydrolase 36/42
MKSSSKKKSNVDELLASSAPITPRKITFQKARHAESLNSFRSKYTPINSSFGDGGAPSKSPKGGKSAPPPSSELEEATLPVPKRSLYPKEKIYEMLQWSKPSAIGAGLHNVGNTCFLNSTLQCLTYCPPLANYFQSRQHSKACTSSPSLCDFLIISHT